MKNSKAIKITIFRQISENLFEQKSLIFSNAKSISIAKLYIFSNYADWLIKK